MKIYSYLFLYNINTLYNLQCTVYIVIYILYIYIYIYIYIISEIYNFTFYLYTIYSVIICVRLCTVRA